MTSATTQKQLNADEWGKHYNLNLKNGVLNSYNNNYYNLQTSEMLKLTKVNDKVLEIGSGTGLTSLLLSKEKRKVTALDYSIECYNLVNTVKTELGLNLNCIMHDASLKLPFSFEEFDVIFQAGLLEHFDFDNRVALLKNWSPHCKKMISLIPNGSSVPYRLGKEIMEKRGIWPYGIENPISTLSKEFNLAGLRVIDEYSIGIDEAFSFLPKNKIISNFIYKFINKELFKSMNQGYLLVTIGEKI